MVRANRKRPLQCQFIAVTPGETAILPIEIKPVPIRKQDLGKKRKAKVAASCKRFSLGVFGAVMRRYPLSVPMVSISHRPNQKASRI